ncbi:MAG: hypothetical protein HY717_19925 [Planctomycetes bacterium]|nr:hypothetical protein [Planctomycetota bacterium]
MGQRRKKARIDPQLLEELHRAQASEEPVEAVLFLREGEEIRQLLKRVQKLAGVAPLEVTIFKNLNSFLVVASARFVEVLLEQPEIEAATKN